MGFGQPLGDRQAQPGAAMGLGHRRSGLSKRLQRPPAAVCPGQILVRYTALPGSHDTHHVGFLPQGKGRLGGIDPAGGAMHMLNQDAGKGRGTAGAIHRQHLKRLSTYIEKNVKLQRAVKSALVYPVGVLTVAGSVITLLLWKVVPIFATLFAGLGVDLPLPTKIVIAMSNFVGSIFGFLIVVAMAGSIFGLKVWYGTPQGRFVLDTIVLKLPVLGMLMRKIAVARFTRTVGTLISSGVPILEGLDITAKTAGNAVVERALQKVRKSLEEGKSLTEPLKESEVCPGMVTQMIAVGEQTGAMDAMLQKIADFYEEEVDAAVKDLLTALEPIMIVFLGLVVGGVVISMYLPLFSLIGKLANH